MGTKLLLKMLFYILWLILLLIINCIVGKTIYHESAFIYECKTNENCVDFAPNSMCFNNKCVYKSRSRRQYNFGVRMLGEECESNDECRRTPVDGTKICLSNQCQCSSGHVPIDGYRCIQDFKQSSSNTQVTKASEIEEAPGYGSSCSTNNDCQRLTIQLECLRGKCVCLEGYVPLGKYLCYNIRGQGPPVIESSTLTSTLSTTTSTFSLQRNKMIESFSKIGSTCRNDYYCRRSISQSHCYNGKCSCIDGYKSLDFVTCVKNINQDLSTTTILYSYKSLLGGKCLTNENCHTLNVRCLNNICTCPIGYFAIDSWNCLKDSGELSDIKTTRKISPSTPTIVWWLWSSSSSTTHQSIITSKNIFHFRCLLHQQCISIDINSHCASYGRCVCNTGHKFDEEQKCIRQIINDDENCD